MPSNHDQDPNTPSMRTGGPGKLRAGLVAGAALALVVGAVATSQAASSAPSSSSAITGAGTYALSDQDRLKLEALGYTE